MHTALLGLLGEKMSDYNLHIATHSDQFLMKNCSQNVAKWCLGILTAVISKEIPFTVYMFADENDCMHIMNINTEQFNSKSI